MTTAVWLSLTTLPSRLAHLPDVLQRWNLSGVEGILLHVPYVHARTGAPYPRVVDPSAFSPAVQARLHVHRPATDYGALTKWVGPAINPLVRLPPDAIVIIVDDDTSYHPDLFARLSAAVTAVTATHGAAAAVCGWGQPGAFWSVQALFPPLAPDPLQPLPQPPQPPPGLRAVDVAEGFSGVAVRAALLHDPAFVAAVVYYSQLSPACFASDDLVVNYVLHHLRVPRYRLERPPPWRQFPLPDQLHQEQDNKTKYQAAAAQLLRTAPLTV